MPVRQRGRSWQADVQFNGRRYRADFQTEESAESWVTAATAAVKDGQPVPSAPERQAAAEQMWAAPAPTEVVGRREADRLQQDLDFYRGQFLNGVPQQHRELLSSFRGSSRPELQAWARVTAEKLVERASGASNQAQRRLPCPLCATGSYLVTGLRQHLIMKRGCPFMCAAVSDHLDSFEFLPTYEVTADGLRRTR